jgi:hypothetical protein
MRWGVLAPWPGRLHRAACHPAGHLSPKLVVAQEKNPQSSLPKFYFVNQYVQQILDTPVASLAIVGNLVIIESLLSVDNAAVPLGPVAVLRFRKS